MFKPLPLGWLAMATLVPILLMLVVRYRASGGTSASFTAPHGPRLNDLLQTPEVSDTEGPSLAVVSYVPTVCADECLEEEFWKSLRRGD